MAGTIRGRSADRVSSRARHSRQVHSHRLNLGDAAVLGGKLPAVSGDASDQGGRASNFATLRITGTRGMIAPGAPANPGPLPRSGNALCARRAAKRLVKSTCSMWRMPLKCHSPEGGTRLYIRKNFILWSPLTESNRRPSPYHVSLCNSAAQVEQLTCRNTSTRWHSQAPDEPTRALFATQSATHFDLAGEPSHEAIDIRSDDLAVCVQALSPRLTSANRLRLARCAVQGWASNVNADGPGPGVRRPTAVLALGIVMRRDGPDRLVVGGRCMVADLAHRVVQALESFPDVFTGHVSRQVDDAD